MAIDLGITVFAGDPDLNADNGIILSDSEAYEPNISNPWDMGIKTL